VQHWNLNQIEAADGVRSPEILHSNDEGRAVLIAFQPGQELREHQVKEHAFIVVVDGGVRISANGESVDAGPGSLFLFEPDEQHAVSSPDGGRILLVLAPWPGPGHYRGGDGGSA
jgi:quercetin dioxygenase-like cupin family protein